MNNDILKYVGKVFSTADDLRGAGFKKSTWPSFMMPFYSLILLEGRMLNKKDELTSKLKLEGYSNDDIIEEIREELEGKPYNKLIIEKEVTLAKICKNDTNFILDFENYLNAYDDETKKLLGIEKFDDTSYLDLLSKRKQIQSSGKSILFNFVKKWSEIDVRKYNNSEITTLEEHIKNKWADISADTSGEHYTPWDIIELITDLIVAEVSKYKNTIDWNKYIKIYDPTCGGGNMLFGCEDSLRSRIKKVIGKELLTQTYGQEINTELYALAKIESQFRDESKIELNDTLKKDMFSDEEFDIIVSNVPYGVDWKSIMSDVKNDKSGRFEFYPSTSDGQLLFLQHILSKHKQKKENIIDGINKGIDKLGFNFSINVTNGSPLFSGDAGSGESDIRKKFLDNDNILALIQLPKEEFFNTKISTYLWLMTTNKLEKNRLNKIQLIDASGKDFYKIMSKSKGDKRNEITIEGRKLIVDTYINFDKCKEDYNKVFDKEFFYYNKQSIELHHKDINGKSIEDILPVKKVKGQEVKGKSISIKDIQTIYSDNEKLIGLNKDGTIDYIFGIDQIDNEKLKDRNKRIQKLLSEIENLKISTFDETTYYIDTNKETIIEESYQNNGMSKFIKELGNGIIKVSSSYKKATKTKEEWIEIKVDLLPKKEKDNEIIPFQEIENGKVVDNNIDDFLDKWVEKEYVKLDNIVGVEINFNKLFYKYEKLRSIEEIVNDIDKLSKEERKLDKDIFDFSPIDITELNIKE